MYGGSDSWLEYDDTFIASNRINAIVTHAPRCRMAVNASHPFIFCGDFRGCYQAQEPEIDRLVIDTRLVSVPVIVSDRSGHYIPNLRRKFQALRQQRRTEDRFFDAAEERSMWCCCWIPAAARGVLDDIRSAARVSPGAAAKGSGDDCQLWQGRRAT